MQVTKVARDNVFIQENDDGWVTHRTEDLYVSYLIAEEGPER